MLLGDKAALPDTVQDTFRAAGISHLLAVSGLHLALLCGLFSFGRRRRFYRPLILVRAAVAVFYMLLTGLPISVLRAGIVFLLVLLGDWFYQPIDLLTLTGAAAVLLGLQNPYAPCDIGFQLSFCAVLGVQASVALTRWEEAHIPGQDAEGWQAQLRRAGLTVLSTVQTAALASLADPAGAGRPGPDNQRRGRPLPTCSRSGCSSPRWYWALSCWLCKLSPSRLPLRPRWPIWLVSCWRYGCGFFTRWPPGVLPCRWPGCTSRGSTRCWCWFCWAYWRWYIMRRAGSGGSCRRGWFCAAVAIVLGVQMQKGVVTMALVGTAGNPAVVCVQDGQAVVLFRGGEANLRAVRSYLADHGAAEQVLTVDLRRSGTEITFDTEKICTAQTTGAYTTRPILNGLTLDIYHTSGGNLAVVGDGRSHIAVMAGNTALSAPVAVDVLCAAGALSDSVQPARHPDHRIFAPLA